MSTRATATAAGRAAVDAASRRGAGPDTFVNRSRDKARNFMVYWRRETKKGSASPYYAILCAAGILFVVYKLSVSYIIPWRIERQNKGLGIVSIRVPMSKEHESEFGVMSRTPLRQSMDDKGVQFSKPEEMLNADPLLWQRATKMPDIPSETAATPTNFTVLTLREYDEKKKQDVFVRTMYALRAPDPTAPPPNSSEVRKRLQQEKALSTFAETLQRAQFKCKALTPTDNCVPAFDVMSEVTRKMLLALGPMYMLRHPRHDILPTRFSKLVEPANLDVLCIGMGDGGAHVSFLNRVFPHFKLDVVEPDGGLLKACRHYLGFQERDGISLRVEDPTSYLRKNVLQSKRYEAIWINMIDENGNIPTPLTKLETLSNIRENLNDRGMVVANIPNHDERRMAAVIQNWRMAFDGRAVILVHCAMSPNTILMTFNDSGDRGIPKFGFTHSVEDMKQLVRNCMLNNPRRFEYDPLDELHEHNFQQLLPGKKYKFRRPASATSDATTV